MAYENFIIITEGHKIPNVTVSLVGEPYSVNMGEWPKDKYGEPDARAQTRNEFIRDNAMEVDANGRKSQTYNLI